MTVLLTPLLPAELETVTVMVSLLSSSSPVIVYLVKAPFTVILSSSSSEQPTEVSLCHSTTNPVTTEPLGTLSVMVMVVAVTVGVSLSTGAGGTVEQNKTHFRVAME